MTEDEKQAHYKYFDALTSPDFASPSRPLHVKINSWDETTKNLEDHIRDSAPFEGKWQTYIKNYRIFIPEQLHDLFSSGGVLTVSTENHLLLFGNKHWSRYQRILAKEVGLSPVHNSVARNTYSNMHRFSRLNADGTIDVPVDLAQYANLQKEIAIIGMIYHAEVHDKEAYISTQKPDARKSMLNKFKGIRFN